MNSTQTKEKDTGIKSVMYDPAFWREMMRNPKWTSHAYKVLVDLVSTDIIVKELAILCSVQLTSKRNDIDFIELMRYTIDRKDAKFITDFFRYIKTHKEYLVHDLRAYMLASKDVSGWVKYMRS